MHRFLLLSRPQLTVLLVQPDWPMHCRWYIYPLYCMVLMSCIAPLYCPQCTAPMIDTQGACQPVGGFSVWATMPPMAPLFPGLNDPNSVSSAATATHYVSGGGG